MSAISNTCGTRGIRLPELLAPAGSTKAIEAAIEAGADAVYFGGKSHNARIFADNVGDDELSSVISLCHAYGTKAYITLNTLTHRGELRDILSYAETLYKSGADALIVADLGVASLIKKYIPGLELHASTQVSGHNVAAAETLASLGFSRMVLAREMSERDIRDFCARSPIEAEVFVHGALCVSASGQCLFSSIVGGRSGNRGECAQPCRLPYTAGGRTSYPLSLKDLSLARHIPSLIDMGVSSLKIEGRMKSPEYVRDVISIYRTLLDERRAANDAEMDELSRIFSRSGFTDGYFTGRVDKKMLGVRTESDKKKSRESVPFDKITRKIPIDIKASFKLDEPSTLTVATDGASATAAGFVPIAAESSPTPRENIERQLTKLGSTPYIARRVDIEAEDGLLIPLSKINELRREAVGALTAPDAARASFRMETPALETEKKKSPPTRTARFLFAKNIPDDITYFDIVYLPLAEYAAHPNNTANGIILPPVIFDSEMGEVEKMLDLAKEAGIFHALVPNIGHLALAQSRGFICHGDYRLGVYNQHTADTLFSLGFEDLILSPELSLAAARDIGGDTSLVVYGRIPLMTLERCVIEDCSECKKNGFTLTDRRGVRFPVYREYPHRNVLYNSVPTYMADKGAELSRYGITRTHFVFTCESAKEAKDIIEAYKHGHAPIGSVRRIK